MQQSSDPMMSRPSRAKQIIPAAILIVIGIIWVVQTMRKGAFVADPSGVAMVTNTRPANGEKDVLPNIFVSAYLNSGHAIDPGTLDVNTVRLYRTTDQHPVPAQVNTSAAGDDIVLTPLQFLDAATKYTFEVKGVKDSTGAELMPFQMTFTTGAGTASSTYPAAFEKIDLGSGGSGGDHEYYTGITVGPDHLLYAGTVDGKIIRRPINPDGTLGDSQVIKSVQAANQGPRLITGIRFDPKSTKDNLILWISHGQFIMNQRGEPSLVGATEWTGKISKISGPELAEYQDVVVGLPRSWRDHLNNQIDFGADGCIYWSQGSHTAMGAPDKKWGGDRVERLLSAAVLRLDPSKVTSTLNVKTPDGGGTYDPFAANAPLTIYASGVRVGYDMLWHSNGHLYTATNGSAAGGNTPSTPADRKYPHRVDEDVNGPYTGPEVAGIKDVDETQPDMLLNLEKGAYYGQPNPMRGEYVLAGGNPTGSKESLEVSKYPVGTKPDRNWHKPAYNFGTSVSPNGMIEFKSDGKLFGGALDGKLLITRFSGGKDIIVLALNEKGEVTESITGIAGLTNFTQPLDITQDVTSGCVYVCEYGGGKLALLRPITDPVKFADLHQNVFRQQVRASAAD
jgi:glucose/arabinose dehydrogenase